MLWNLARYTFDRKKITFYYTAPERVDFRELLKDLTQEFKRVRIDLRHIGVRDETSILQGQGICGQDYCCCKFLKKFEQVNTKLAKDQGIPITPGKITGACGRLLCCLNYEYKNYLDAARTLPPVGSGVMTPEGVGRVFMVNFLKKTVNVKLEDGKIKEYQKEEIEMIDGEVNIDINIDNKEPNSYSDIIKERNELEYTQARVKELEKTYQSLKQEKALKNTDIYEKNITTINDVSVLIMKVENQEVEILKNLADNLLNKMGKGFIFFANIKGDNVNFIARSNITTKAGDIVKMASVQSNGNGGGSPTFAQGGGKTTEHLDEIFENIKKEICAWCILSSHLTISQSQQE